LWRNVVVTASVLHDWQGFIASDSRRDQPLAFPAFGVVTTRHGELRSGVAIRPASSFGWLEPTDRALVPAEFKRVLEDTGMRNGIVRVAVSLATRDAPYELGGCGVAVIVPGTTKSAHQGRINTLADIVGSSCIP
jgi:hypothetical protein